MPKKKLKGHIDRIRSRLIFYRELRNMSQEELAMAVGYSESSSKSMISQVESGDKLPSLEKLLSLAKELGIHPYVLLMEEDIPKDKLEAMNHAAFAILK